MRVYGEPLAQFLTLDESEYFNKDWDHAARRVMSPPFRSKDHQDSLWAGLQAGSLQVVATDHAAFNTEQKRAGRDDFRIIPNGSNGLEERMPVLWTEGVETGRLTPNEFVAVTSTKCRQDPQHLPQEGRDRGRGRCRYRGLGSENHQNHLSASNHHSILDYNVFEGFEVTANARYTLSPGARSSGPGVRTPNPNPAEAASCPAPPSRRHTQPSANGKNSPPPR